MKKTVWTPDFEKRLVELFPENTNLYLAGIFGVTESAIVAKAFKLRLKKSKEFRYECASKTFFPKGHKPMNAGKKQTEYMTPEAIEKTKCTRFKKGNIPANHKPLGYERVSKDGYVEIKAAEPNVFLLKHRMIWMEHHGEIPPGMNIQFKDGNKRNFDIENLYMISRTDQMKNENSYHARYPKEIQLLIQLKGALNRQINKANKINKENGSNRES